MTDGRSQRSVGAPAIIAGAIFIACLLGIHTRPAGFLASIWPANAILLGLMFRLPGAARSAGWLAAAAAYMAADLLSGTQLAKSLLLNLGNLVGVATAYLMLRRLPDELVRLRQPLSMLHVLFAVAAGSAVAGIVGSFAFNSLFDRPPLDGWVFWFAAEFVNYIAILPVMLSAPPLRSLLRERRRSHLWRDWKWAPVMAVAGSCVAALLIGGPGALAFPVPALLWCGLAYPVFLTAIITVAFSTWALLVMSAGYVPNPAEVQDAMSLVSVRLGVSLVALAPIMLASAMESRNELLAQLRHLAAHDALTDAESRGAFRNAVESRLKPGQGRPFGLLVMDLDHFKLVNDSYGHAAGDAVLVSFVQRVRACLRDGDRLGRLGGEEFGILLGGCSAADAEGVAQRLLGAIRQPVDIPGGRQITVTASGGLLVVEHGNADNVDSVFAAADALLYRAKETGRDRVETGPRGRGRRGRNVPDTPATAAGGR